MLREKSQINLEELKKHGYFIVKNFLSHDTIENIKETYQNIFLKQIKSNNFNNETDIPHSFDEAITYLYKHEKELFISSAKQSQKILPLYEIASSVEVKELLDSIEIENPVISYMPLLLFNSKILNDYITPFHQDWRSMQGSLDSIVIWIPLQDVYDGFGNIEFVKGSHKYGLLKSEKDTWYRKLKKQINPNDVCSVNIKKGDALVFSTFLIHRTGINHEKKYTLVCST